MGSSKATKQVQERIISICIACVGVIAIGALFGWAYDISFLKTWLPGRPEMKANTAICILLLCLATEFLRVKTRKKVFVGGGVGLATVVAIISILTLLQYLYPIDFGIDQLLFDDPRGFFGNLPPGRFSPIAGVNLLLLSFALIVDAWPKRPWYRASQASLLIVTLISLQSFLGNILGSEDMFGIFSFIPMAAHTAFSFLLLSGSMLLARPGNGYMERFTSNFPSAVMARRTFLAVILAPLLIKVIVTIGAQTGFYSDEFAIFLQMMGSILFMVMIVVVNAGAMLGIEREREESRGRERTAFQEAEAERAKLHRILLQAPTHVDVYRGPEHRFELVHPQTVALLGGVDPKGQRLVDVFPNSAVNGFLDASDQVYRTGVPFFGKEMELKVKGADGVPLENFFDISIQPWQNSAGEIEGVITFSIDVTDKVRARRIVEESREEARRSAEQLRLVKDALPSVISYIGTDLRYQLVNLSYTRWFGKPKSEFIGRTIEEALGKEAFDRAAPYIHRVLQGEKVNYQNLVKTAGGGELFVDVTYIPDFDQTGKMRGFVVVGHDVTHMRRTQQELKAAKEQAEEANIAKSRFLANMSHEIRTPLGVILGFSDLAIESLDQPEEARGYLTSIRRNADELAKLLGEILDLSKVEANELNVEKIQTHLRPVIDEVRALLDGKATEKGIRLEFVFEGAVPTSIETDPTRLRQILINLVGNAIKFTDQGWVRMTVSLVKPMGLGQPMKLKFEVRDTGIGITPDQRERLFKHFSQADSSMTRKFGGTGLGLVLSRQLAQALGGSLELAASEPGKGSCFVATIDGGLARDDSFAQEWGTAPEISSLHEKRQEERQEEPPSSQGKTFDLSGFRILLVEDSVENQILVSRYLKPTGAKVELADNGLEGLQKARQLPLDVVLMDIQMPVMDGFKATHLLREQCFEKPILALTAHAFQEEREKALHSGFSGYLTKPINKTLLLEALLEVRERSGKDTAKTVSPEDLVTF